MRHYGLFYQRALTNFVFIHFQKFIISVWLLFYAQWQIFPSNCLKIKTAVSNHLIYRLLLAIFHPEGQKKKKNIRLILLKIELLFSFSKPSKSFKDILMKLILTLFSSGFQWKRIQERTMDRYYACRTRHRLST